MIRALSCTVCALLWVSCHVERGKPPMPALGPPEIAWKVMTHDQKMYFMEKVVLPKMKAEFVAFDRKRFAGFSCKTCHGAGVDDGTYELPNRALRVLPGTVEGMVPLVKEKGPWVDFMTRKVKPTMAKLLDLEEWDRDDPQPDAFGCQECHAIE